MKKFCTENGWEGENYNPSLSIKEIADAIRKFIKTYYNYCKFSITTNSTGLLNVTLMESPYRLYKTFDELTREVISSHTYNGLAIDTLAYDCEYQKVIRHYVNKMDIGSWRENEVNDIIRPMYDKDFGEEADIYFPKFLTKELQEITKAVTDYVNSFNYDNSDVMTDYFDKGFYFFGIKTGKDDKPYKVVECTKKKDCGIKYVAM